MVMEQKEEITKVRIGNLPVVHGLPLYIALEKNYFKEVGIEVELIQFDSPNEIIDALIRDKLDFGSPSIALGIAGIASQKYPDKLRIYAFAGGTKETPNENLIIHKESNITSVRELKGKRLGILSGTIQWKTIAKHFLAKYGLKIDIDVKIIELSPSKQVPALESKQIDALLCLEPISTLALEKGIGKILFKGPAEHTIADPFYPGIGVLNTKFARENPLQTDHVLDAFEKAIEFIKKNPKEAREYLKGYTVLSDELVSKSPLPIFKLCHELTYIDRDSIRKFYDLFSKHGVVKDKIYLDNLLYLISIRNLKKKFGEQEILRDFSFDVDKGDIVALFGPNASGKSTTLNILSKLSEKEEDEQILRNFNLSELSYVFQNYRDSLLPWRTNYKNVAFPLELQGMSKDKIKKRIDEVASLFEFKTDLDNYPYELSGGQQQILAFIRALVTNPKVLFIDEPFSALDYENNLILRKHIQKYYIKYKPTILIITHNIEEAVHLANKIIILSKKPTVVSDIILNPEPYPRDAKFLKTETFNKIKDDVLSAFQRGAKLNG